MKKKKVEPVLRCQSDKLRCVLRWGGGPLNVELARLCRPCQRIKTVSDLGSIRSSLGSVGPSLDYLLYIYFLQRSFFHFYFTFVSREPGVFGLRRLRSSIPMLV